MALAILLMVSGCIQPPEFGEATSNETASERPAAPTPLTAPLSAPALAVSSGSTSPTPGSPSSTSPKEEGFWATDVRVDVVTFESATVSWRAETTPNIREDDVRFRADLNGPADESTHYGLVEKQDSGRFKASWTGIQQDAPYDFWIYGSASSSAIAKGSLRTQPGPFRFERVAMAFDGSCYFLGEYDLYGPSDARHMAWFAKDLAGQIWYRGHPGERAGQGKWKSTFHCGNDLQPDTQYFMKVLATSSNQTLESQIVEAFTPPNPSSRISDVRVEFQVNESQSEDRRIGAAIHWKLDGAPACGSEYRRVDYGINRWYEKRYDPKGSPLNDDPCIRWISFGLSPATLYHFRVYHSFPQSDGSVISYYSNHYTFTTPD